MSIQATIKPIYEFLMWDNCSNNCSFCFQRDKPRLFSIEQQKCISELAIQYLKSDNFEFGSHILFVGGELFDNSNRRNFLLDMFNEVSLLLKNNTIDQLYVNTNLLYSADCLSIVVDFLENMRAKDAIQKIHFTTSYDVVGRFKTPQAEEKFFKNLHTVRDSFRELQIIVNMILTNDLCQTILNNKIDFECFQREHEVKVNLIPYIVKDKTLAADRKTLFKAINHLRLKNVDLFNQFLAEQDLKVPRKMMYAKDGQWIRCECKLSDCGHSVNFKRYSENNSCFVCDLKKLFG